MKIVHNPLKVFHINIENIVPRARTVEKAIYLDKHPYSLQSMQDYKEKYSFCLTTPCSMKNNPKSEQVLLKEWLAVPYCSCY